MTRGRFEVHAAEIMKTTGFLCIDKSQGITSRDAVNVVQRLIRPTKVGHAGTLDPMATGVLVLALGNATKLISHVQRMRKYYSAEFQLGVTSDTEDITGEVEVQTVDTPPPTPLVHETTQQFVGQIEQLPPKYSALRVNGKRAHELARQGKEVVLKSRPIEIDKIEITHYAYPQLHMNVVCGSGTYIRSLGRDIGEQLGCGAAMSNLRRTRIGHFDIGQSVVSEELKSLDDVQHHLQPIEHGFELPKHQLTLDLQTDLSFGRKLDCDFATEAEFAAVSESGKLLAIMQRVNGHQFKASINFSAM